MLKPILNIHTNYQHRRVTISIPERGQTKGIAVGVTDSGILFKENFDTPDYHAEWIPFKHVCNFTKPESYYRDSSDNSVIIL